MTDEKTTAEGREPGKITIDTPQDWKDMTPHELVEYARENPEEWHKAVSSLKTTFEQMHGKLNSNVADAIRAGLMLGVSDQITDNLAGELKSVAEKLTMPNYDIKSNIIARRIKEIEFDLSKIIQAIATANYISDLPENADAEALDAVLVEITEVLYPFIDDILKADPASKWTDTDDMLDALPGYAYNYLLDDQEADIEAKGTGWTGIGRPPADMLTDDIAAFLEIIKRARAAREQAEAKAAAVTEAAEAEKLPTVTYKNRPGIELTTDKLMTVFFGANAPAAPKGQIPGQMAFLPVKYEKTGAPEITLYYTYDFDDDLFKRLKLEKKIDDEDYFLLSFIASYWRGGGRSVSVAKLYKDMTGENPNNKQLTALTNRLIKIAGTNIFINDKEVRQAWNIEDENKTYREILTPLAPIKVGAERFIARGKVVEAGIEILAEPDIMKLGYEMGQYTTIPKTLLHVKKKNGRLLTRSPRFYRVLHFLIRRISAIKSGNLPHKILYDTFYAEIGETTPRGRQLARDCMYTVLDHFKTCDKWITGYREETTVTTGQVGVRIFCADTTKNKVTTKK